MEQAEQTGDSNNPPTKRQRVESSVNVTVSGEAFSMTTEAFGRLEGFVADKIAHSEKKTRNPIVKKQEGRYEINRGAAEFQILRAYLEGKPLSKIRDVDKKKKVLKEAKFFSFPDADYEQLTGAISLPTFKGAPERHFLKSTVEEACYEQVCINKKYVVGAGPEHVSVWSTTSKQLLYTFQVPRNGHRRHTIILSRSPADLSFLFTASGENISVFNLESGTTILDFTPSSIPSSSSSSSDSSTSDSSTTTTTTATTETTTSTNGSSPSPSPSSTLPPHAPSPTQIAYKNNKILMCTTSGKETSVHFFSLSLFVSPPTWEKTVSFTRESGARVTCCDFYQNAEGNFVAVLGCEDGNVQVYNLSTTPPTKTKTIEDAHYSKDNHSTYSANSPSPSSAVTHVKIKRDLPHLVSSGCDGSVAIWDLSKDCKVLQRFDTGLKLGVHALDMDDDDAICLFGAAHDFNVRVHDLLSGEHLKTACMDEKRSARFDVHSVGYCGDFVVAGVSDSRVRLLKWRRE